MKIFFLQFRVIPHNINEHFELIDGALASCWIKDNNQQSAYIKAEFYVSKYDWDIADSAGVCVYGKIKEKRSGEKRKCHQEKQEGYQGTKQSVSR
jgi:hypothetical protein